MARITDDPIAYNDYVEDMRKGQFPMLKDTTYLDHAGTTLYSKALMDRFHSDMMGNLLGNPHSASASSQNSTQMIENVRLELLRFFGADPDSFDLVFTANATAGIKLVMEAFREQDGGFRYGYHVDSHTSLVGVREAAREHHCFGSDEEVEKWIDASEDQESVCGSNLFAYPAQSNMNGRRLPLAWIGATRQAVGRRTYSLLDAAAYVSTSPLHLGDSLRAPDFTVLSLYKIFGFPDLGALIVRKGASSVFQKRAYFGGGTVDMVVCLKEQWHVKRIGLHEQLEDGTLPIHSIIALQAAMDTHRDLFGTLDLVSKHTMFLAKRLHDGLTAMKHANGASAVVSYKHSTSEHHDRTSQGPVVAFNIRNSRGACTSTTEVEKLASIKNFHIRTGGLCNPGGVASSLGLSPWEMQENFSAGHRCSGENDIMNGKPTGMIRVSLGAMSTVSDVDAFLGFIGEFFVESSVSPPTIPSTASTNVEATGLHVESLTVYPIKSCAGWQVPSDQSWEIRREGLAWDREWCIVHEGTGVALSQKRYPRMALIRPTLDFTAGRLHIQQLGRPESVSVPLSLDPAYFESGQTKSRNATVCGEAIHTRTYDSVVIAEYLTRAIGVACTLARFPSVTASSPSVRHSKSHLRTAHQQTNIPRPILLSNESPILTITRSSLNRLNEQIKMKGGKAAHASVFRANIVLSQNPTLLPGFEQPWAEDMWQGMRVGGPEGFELDFLGGCRRCQMVCVDQESAERNEEPFVTLAKTRRFEGRVLFGVHTALAGEAGSGGYPRISVGDAVETYDRQLVQ